MAKPAQMNDTANLLKTAAGKIERREETDAMKDFMKDFVDYAKAQGSTSPEKYYTNLTTRAIWVLKNIIQI